MKSTKSFLSLTILFLAGLMAAQGQSMVLITKMTSGGDLMGEGGFSAMVKGCNILLPICLLDLKANSRAGHQSFVKSQLREQGYSAAEIASIIHDQNVVLDYLRGRKAKIVLEKHESVASVSRGLKQIHPRVSDAYVDFFSQVAH